MSPWIPGPSAFALARFGAPSRNDRVD